MRIIIEDSDMPSSSFGVQGPMQEQGAVMAINAGSAPVAAGSRTADPGHAEDAGRPPEWLTSAIGLAMARSREVTGAAPGLTGSQPSNENLAAIPGAALDAGSAPKPGGMQVAGMTSNDKLTEGSERSAS
jgi:hypothetical protein